MLSGCPRVVRLKVFPMSSCVIWYIATSPTLRVGQVTYLPAGRKRTTLPSRRWVQLHRTSPSGCLAARRQPARRSAKKKRSSRGGDGVRKCFCLPRPLRERTSPFQASPRRRSTFCAVAAGFDLQEPGFVACSRRVRSRCCRERPALIAARCANLIDSTGTVCASQMRVD